MIQVNHRLCSGCGVCVSACPQLALFLIQGGVQVETQRCNGCSDLGEQGRKLCLEACPNHALQWIEEDRAKGEVEVIPVENQPVAEAVGMQQEIQSLETNTTQRMPRIGSILKQVGEGLIKEIPTILPSIVEAASCRAGGRSSFGRSQRQRRRRRQCW